MKASKWAMVENGVVVNICLWDGDLRRWFPNADVTMVRCDESADATIGAMYDGEIFTRPAVDPKPKPKSLEERLTELESEIANLKKA